MVCSFVVSPFSFLLLKNRKGTIDALVRAIFVRILIPKPIHECGDNIYVWIILTIGRSHQPTTNNYLELKEYASN